MFHEFLTIFGFILHCHNEIYDLFYQQQNQLNNREKLDQEID